MTKLACVDLFSGIGGISQALSPIVDTVLYCEWNPYCQTVLAERMREGHLHRAPIHSDITSLYLPQGTHVNMLAGGFPCQDISSMGHQAGIEEGTRSGLFLEIMRLVDDNPSIQVLFLENVANILRCGIADVVKECTRRGFRMQWTVRSAGDMGAPHVRARWFCLAVRGEGITIPSLPSDGNKWDWTTTCPEPMTLSKINVQDEAWDPQWALRAQCLGNTVVPCVVRAAAQELITGYDKWDSLLSLLESSGVPIEHMPATWPESALVDASGNVFAIPKAFRPVRLYKDGKALHVNGSILMHMPTPRRGLNHASSLTERSMRDLPTVLIYSDEAKVELGADYPTHCPPYQALIANIRFIEWMMGYPRDWTRVRKTKPREASPIADPTEDAPPAPITSPLQPSSQVAKKKVWNGMHMLMHENSGKTVQEVSVMWKALTEEQRRAYSLKAKELREA